MFMNAAIALPEAHSVTSAPVEAARGEVASGEAEQTTEVPSEPRSFASYQAQGIAVAVLVVFVGTAGFHYATQGGAIDALGLALYLAIWIGLGFGFLIGGVRWGIEQVELDQQH